VDALSSRPSTPYGAETRGIRLLLLKRLTAEAPRSLFADIERQRRNGEHSRQPLSSFEVTLPHSLEQGDRRERGQRVEASDENEHRGPAPCLLL
jgi:hypothetical protein